jgi:hypothetical protein
MCSNPDQPDGTACDDGDACTTHDSCVVGACVGRQPVVCNALDACHLAGTCDRQSGRCSNPAAADGTACPGGACVQGRCTARTDGGAAPPNAATGCGCAVGARAAASDLLLPGLLAALLLGWRRMRRPLARSST